MPSTQSNQQQVSTPEPSSKPAVLYIVGKSDLGAFHASHLREAGYELHIASTSQDGLEALQQVRVSAVVIGHALSLVERLEIEEAVRRSRPKPRIVLLYETSIAKTEQADAVLNINSEPQHLAQTIRYLLTGAD